MQHPPNSDLILSVAKFYINNQSTVRDTSIQFNISKSSVHNYLTIYLQNLDYSLYLKAQNILKQNFNTKHIRGGYATQNKYNQLPKTKK